MRNKLVKSHYNDAPPFMREISLQEFTKGIFLYCVEIDFKQVRGKDGSYDLRLFLVPNFDDLEMGYAIKMEWKNHEPITSFHIFGHDDWWKSFKNRFSAQFKGDNS